MRYAVLSDVHGNLEALEAVLRDARRGRLDACLCLGDTVGYGPDPNECVARIRSLGGPVIAGNHDLAAAGMLDPSAFTPLARAAIEWTRDVLTHETRAWLATLPARLDDPAFLAVHGSPRDPIEEYIIDLPTSLAIFTAHAFSLCLVGHSHVPGAFILQADGAVSARRLPVGRGVRLARAARYIVNVGSVGQPRDRDSRAAYALWSVEDGAVAIRRVPYDVDAARRKIVAGGLPQYLADRLAWGA